VYFTVYEVISSFLAPKKVPPLPLRHSCSHLRCAKNASIVSAGAVMVAGGIGGMAFWTAIYPVDVGRLTVAIVSTP